MWEYAPHGVSEQSRQQRHGGSEMSMHPLQSGYGQNVPIHKMSEQLVKQGIDRQCTFKIVLIHSQHRSKAALTSHDTVIGLGSDVPGCPALIRVLNW